VKQRLSPAAAGNADTAAVWHAASMRIRLLLTLSGLSLGGEAANPLVLTLSREHALTVTIESDKDTTACTAELEYQPTAKNESAFAALAAGQLPDRHLPRDRWPRELDFIAEDGTFELKYAIPMFVMPQGFRDAMGTIVGELRWAADTAVGALRWRTRTVGPLRPFSSRGAEWSLNGTTWHPLPASTSLEIQGHDRLFLRAGTAAEIQALLDAGEHEPLAHELLREALNLGSSNPRSALLIGVAALEVGIKQYIASCVPEAKWLAEEAPSPPVVPMLKTYLPTLTSPAGETTSPPDKAHHDALVVGVGLRNKLTHVGQDVTRERVFKTLRAIRDVLWQLDAARGHRWAEAFAYPSLDEDLEEGARRI